MEPGKENKIKTKKNQGLIIAVLVSLLIAMGLAIGILLVQQNQQIKEKAATPSGSVRIFLSPESKNTQVDQVFPVNILLDTAGKYISALTIDLSYTFNQQEPPLMATDIQINSNLVVNENWNFPLKTINKDNQVIQIRIAGLNSSTEGYKTDGEEIIATINFKAQNEGSINLTFNPTTTKVTEKTSGEDVLLTPSSSGNYTVQDSQNQTPTATPNSSNPTTTPTPNSTRTPIPAITPSLSPAPIPQSGFEIPTIIGTISGFFLMAIAIALSL